MSIRKVIAGFLILALSQLVLAQKQTKPTSGILKVYDSTGTLLGPLVSVESNGGQAFVKYDYLYQGQSKFTILTINRWGFVGPDSTTYGAPLMYTDPGCQGLPFIGQVPVMDLVQPAAVVFSRSTDAAWLVVLTGVEEPNLFVAAVRSDTSNDLTCRPVVNFNYGLAYQVEIITNLYESFTPPFEIK